MADEAGPATHTQTEESLAECVVKFDEGVAAIKSGDYEQAVQLFADVLQVRTHHYGQLAPESASAYYRYGCALLYQAQESADVFGGPIRSTADGDKENEAEAKPAPPAPQPAPVPAAAAEDKGKGPANEDTAAEGDDVAEDENAGKAEPDVEGDLQLAWENLETARTIWSYTPDTHLAELADVHSQLADVNMENEAFEDALADIDSALEFKAKAGAGDDDRAVADLQFRRCMTLQFLDRNKESLESVNAAIAILQRCKDKTAAIASKEDATEEEKQAAAKTLADLSAVLDDLKDKVEELKEVMKEEEATKGMVRGMVAQLAAAQQGGAAGGASSSAFAPTGNDAQKPSTGPSPVKDLGVVGRGTKRINLAPVAAVEGATAAAATGAPPAKKRALEDLMGGGGETTTGFGGGGDAGDKKEEEPAVPAFLQAMKKADEGGDKA